MGPKERGVLAGARAFLGTHHASQLACCVFLGRFHKLNPDYFSHELSCGVVQWQRFVQKIPFLPQSSWTLNAVTIGTVALELLIPVGLVVQRTRTTTLLFGLGFHFVLGVFYPRFSMFAFAGLSLFLSSTHRDALVALVDRVVPSPPNKARTTAAIVAALLGVVLHLTRPSSGVRIGMKPEVLAWLVVGFLLLAGFLWTWRNATAESLGLRAGIAWVVPCLLFINGATPHLGIKNGAAFNMYSNLATEGGISNHALIPSGVQISGTLADMVHIDETNDPGLGELVGPTRKGSKTFTAYAPGLDRAESAAPSWWVPRAAVARHLTKAVDPVRLTYQDAQGRHQTSDARRDPNLAGPGLWSRVLTLKAVPTTDRRICVW